MNTDAMNASALAFGIAAFLTLGGCLTEEPQGPCVGPIVATDIDETLTTADNEFWQQLSDASYDPAMRPEANLLLQDYAALGYGMVYVTARGTDQVLPDGRSTTEATQDWLDDHAFPQGLLYLHEGLPAAGATAVEYKTGVLEALKVEGYSMAYAYGNADTDIEAFQNAGFADTNIFLVGDLAGQMGVEPILSEDAYANHRATQMGSVDSVTCTVVAAE